MITFTILGRVREAETLCPLAGWFVKAFDKDIFFDDVLGSAITDRAGRFEIFTELDDFREIFERRPDVYFRVAPRAGGSFVHSTEDSVAVNADVLTGFEILVPVEATTDPGSVSFDATDVDGEQQSEFSPGETIHIEAAGMRPRHSYDILVSTSGEELFTARLITDLRGRLPRTALWPQSFLDDPRHQGVMTIDEARQRWADAALGLEIRDGERSVAELEASVSREQRPVIFASDGEGRPRNAFEPSDASMYLTAAGLPFEGDARLWLVPRQAAWALGDQIRPVDLTDGVASFDVTLEAAGGVSVVEVVRSDRLHPGAYDLVLRPIRYGFEADERLVLTGHDVVTRSVTGLVVREDFWLSKPVLGGCVNRIPISGRLVSGSPYFRYANTFSVGEDVWGALDPGAVDSGNVGKMCAFYVVPSKNAMDWGASNALNHLPVLGGNAAAQRIKVQSSCINANEVLLWPGAADAGEYDIVADFGNNTPDAMSFVPDHAYDTPLDIIDGYFLAGFRVVEDPGTMSDIAHAGTAHYLETTNIPGFGIVGDVTVQDENMSYHTPGGFTPVNSTVDRLARVYFPADVAGVTDPNQISAAASDYPLVVVVHGNGHTYTSYDALLEHLAKNGFIAASIHLKSNMRGLGRANVFFEHMPVLQALFGSKMQNNIGLMGHSRGGEGVVKAARLNETGGLGHNINAVISLAPTDQYGSEVFAGAWATPYFVLYGSRDGDINGDIWTSGYTVPQTGFALWDRADDALKSMAFVHRATHNGFITTNYDADTGDVGALLAPADQQKVTFAYMNAFFRQHLKSEPIWAGMFSGEWRPASVEAAGIDLFVQYGDGTTRVIDDFQSGTGWTSSSSGGTVIQAGLPANPQEGNLHDHFSVAGLDPQSPHDTKGMMLRWDSLGDQVVFGVQPAHKDVSGFEALSLRISQKEASPHNPANQAQNLRVALRDTAGHERAVRAGSFGTIPFPDQRADATVRKSAMTSVRIPLSSYTIVAAGADVIDLTEIESIKLLFTEKSTGEIDIDDIEFTD